MGRLLRPGGGAWEYLRRKTFERDGYRCRQCGKAGRLECDHIQAIVNGGAAWDESNLQTLCRACHMEKTKTDLRYEGADQRAWRQSLKEFQAEKERVLNTIPGRRLGQIMAEVAEEYGAAVERGAWDEADVLFALHERLKQEREIEIEQASK